MSRKAKLRLAVWKLTSCDGCQLTLLNCEDELLAVADAVEVAYFLEAKRAPARGSFDVSLVEGSITTPADAERIREIRRRSRLLIALGACATAGGIQALRNLADVRDLAAYVYGSAGFVQTLATSTPISDHVAVDGELRGCPISGSQLLELLQALLAGRRPKAADYSVCVECKLAGTSCVLVDRGAPCLGPVTHAGCGALCPGFGRGCYGCYGPSEGANPSALSSKLLSLGMGERALSAAYRTFNSSAPAFREEGDRHGS